MMPERSRADHQSANCLCVRKRGGSGAVDQMIDLEPSPRPEIWNLRHTLGYAPGSGCRGRTPPRTARQRRTARTWAPGAPTCTPTAVPAPPPAGRTMQVSRAALRPAALLFRSPARPGVQKEMGSFASAQCAQHLPDLATTPDSIAQHGLRTH